MGQDDRRRGGSERNPLPCCLAGLSWERLGVRYSPPPPTLPRHEAVVQEALLSGSLDSSILKLRSVCPKLPDRPRRASIFYRFKSSRTQCSMSEPLH